ncbi:transcriptional repressor LexA [Deferribacterales bacterium Es71-Z0220]|uniref:transcriptional repressor LexA n=1 Tax=Deferrivibrio essentukiensis TaxID=2880922 RepID=UPI001F625E37|nr:transcriptional repressor LexA [Deferrivibrio essentukiensis]MCB4204212.1 transcriptional repressor LexA [Deferrivibrio essentukiensis]
MKTVLSSERTNVLKRYYVMTKEERKNIILNFVDNFLADNGYPPSIREICRGTGINSTSVVKKILDQLKDEGKIKKANQLARGILLNREIPILGKIKAGTPVISEENIEGYVNLDTLTNIQNSFFLKIEGDSMKNINILDGDLALIRQQNILNNNEIGAFRINGEVTLKRIKIDKNKIILRPENENYEDIIINETDNFEVIGKLIYVLKDFRDK